MTTVSNLPWTVATVATSPTIQSTLTFNLLALSRARLMLVGSMSTPTISLAPKSPAPIASLPVPEPRSRTFRPVMSRCSKLAMKSSSAPTSGETGYCSRDRSGSSRIRIFERLISSWRFERRLGTPFLRGGLVRVLEALPKSRLQPRPLSRP